MLTRRVRRPMEFGVAATLVVAAAACGGEGTDPPDESTPPPEDTAEIVQAVARTANEEMPGPGPSSDGNDLLDQLQAAAGAVETLPGVAAVRVDQTLLSATAVLESGVPVVIMNNRPTGEDSTVSLRGAGSPMSHAVEPTDAGAAGSSGAAEVDADVPAAERPPAELPESRRAAVVAIDGGQAQADIVEGRLENRGYEVSELGGSLADMRQYDDLGVLYLDTHGAAFRPVEDIGDDVTFGDARYALQTSTEVDLERGWFEAHESELLAGDLVLSINGAEDAEGRTVKVAITEGFIAEHWDLGGGLAFIHACYFGADPFQDFDPRPMRDAILTTAETLVTFDNFTNARPAQSSIRQTFDMLLGAGVWSRPWDMGAVRTALAEMGLDTFHKPDWVLGPFEFGGNQVNVTFHGSDRLALRPSIDRMEVVDNAPDQPGRLTLHGQFGSDPGHVFLGAEELSVAEWTPDRIVTHAPLDLSGRVRTTVHDEAPAVNGDELRSNGVDLTKWDGTINARFWHSDPAQDWRVDFSVRLAFRADVHRTRESPTDQVPEYPDEVTTYVSLASSGAVEATGSAVSRSETTSRLLYTGGKDISWILDEDELASGTPKLDSGAEVGSGPEESFLGGVVRLRPAAEEAELCGRLYGVWREEFYFRGALDETRDLSVDVLKQSRDDPHVRAAPNGLHCITLDLPNPDDMRISGESVTVSPTPVDENYDVWVGWSDLYARNAPD